MAIAKYIVFSLLGFGGGIVISGAVFAFIAIIGVVPRLAQKSHTEKYIKLYDGVIELLELLKSKGKNIYLLSNAQRVFTFSEMKMLGIEKYFDDILFSADYEICKPDINFYNTLIKKHNLDIKDSIMIGNDYICDIAGATNAGLNSLYLHSNLSPEIKGPLTSTYSIMNMDISKISEFIIDSTKK